MPAVVRARRATLAPLAALMAVVAAGSSAPALAQCESAKLLASDGATEQSFGFSVAIAGHSPRRAVIGAPGDDGNGPECGAAYVFRLDDSGWLQEAKLLASDGGELDHFGYSVAIYGHVAVIGAYGDNDNTGSAYVFCFNGSAWIEEDKLIASDGEPNEYFGISVDVTGDVILVGAPIPGDNGPASGAAYVFHYDGSTWVEQAKLLPSDGRPFDLFGAAVAISDNTAVIGAPWDEDNGWRAGSAYVFRFDGSAWTQEQQILASDGAGADTFGASVAISGDTAVIGAPTDQHNGIPLGSAYVFRFDGWAWGEQVKLLASDAEQGDQFGVGVAIDGDSALIGSGRIDESGERIGGAYVFRRDGFDWPEQARLLGSDSEGGDHFGRAVTIADGSAVIGAHGDDDNGSQSGSAYVFDLDPTPGDLDCDGDVAQADLGILLADWGCTGGDCPGDCDGDGDTDQADLGVLLANWGRDFP